jgi:OOP family OmpA-OmpF porin
MNLKMLVVTFCAIGLSLSSSFGQITENPKVEEQSAGYVKIKRVELTDKYTIIYLQFNERSAQTNPARPDGFPGNFPPGFPGNMNPGQAASSIWLDPETRLFKPGEVAVKFRLIRTENIPTNNVKKVTPGEKVDFVAYFERLSPGIEVFDFYEGRSREGQQSWNFYGIHINNPLKSNANKAVGATPKVPSKKPVPATSAPTPVEEKEPEAPAGDVLAAVKGTVYNAKTKELVPARISYAEDGDTLQVKSSSGRFRIGIDPKSKYELRASAPGFYNSNIEIAPSDSSGKMSFTADFYLTPLSVGETIALPNIYFATSEFSILPESFTELNLLVQMMKDNPGIRIRVEGHTDSVGDADKNLELSRKRAEAVREYLIQNGIDAKRIEAKGLGATRLLTRAGSEEERRKNRRVEFVITEN